MSAKVFIRCITTIPTPREIQGRIDGAARRVMREWGRTITQTFQESWIGWRYVGRPPDAPRLVSHDAWAFTVDTTGQTTPAIVVTNNARDWRKGRSYVATVHRSGMVEPEWIRVAEDEVYPMLPAFRDALTDAFAREAFAPVSPRKVGTQGGADTVVSGMVL